MAQRNVTQVQWSLGFTATITHEDAGKEIIVDLPPGFVLQDAVFIVDEAFDGGATVDAADNRVSPTTIFASTAITSVKVVNIDVEAKWEFYPMGGRIVLDIAGSPTVGAARYILSGFVMGRQNERFGTSANP